MAIKDTFFQNVAAQRFKTLQEKICEAITRETTDLNLALQGAGVGTRFSIGHNRRDSELYIQRTTTENRPLCITSGTGKGVRQDILISFSSKEDLIRLSSDVQHFQHMMRLDYTRHSWFRYDDEEKLNARLGEALSELLTSEEKEILYKYNETVNGKGDDPEIHKTPVYQGYDHS